MKNRRPFRPLFWLLAQLGSRVRVKAPTGLTEGTDALPEPSVRYVPTRHGAVRVLVQEPVRPSPTSPVVLHLHGGGFVNRYPEQDLHIARHLAVTLNAWVFLADYDTAPRVRYPVAEEQVFDVARWLQTATQDEWSGHALSLSGVSAGAKLAVNVCQQLHASGLTAPAALALIVPVLDVTRTDRTSGIRRPAISPLVQRFVGWAYFPDIDRRSEPLASPLFDTTLPSQLPPTLVLTGRNDTLAPEGAHLVRMLREAGAATVHHEYPDADHDFIAGRDSAVIRDALRRLAEFLARTEDHRPSVVVDPTPRPGADDTPDHADFLPPESV